MQSSEPHKAKIYICIVFHKVKEIWGWNWKNVKFLVFILLYLCRMFLQCPWNKVSRRWSHFPFAGVDNCGRTVMVVVGRNIPVTLIDMDKVSHSKALFYTWYWFLQLVGCEFGIRTENMRGGRIVCIWAEEQPWVCRLACTIHFSTLGVRFCSVGEQILENTRMPSCDLQKRSRSASDVM